MERGIIQGMSGVSRVMIMRGRRGGAGGGGIGVGILRG